MFHDKVRLTIVECEKLRNRVNQGRLTSYRVQVTPGDVIGIQGRIFTSCRPEATNDPDFCRPHSQNPGWMQRLRLAYWMGNRKH